MVCPACKENRRKLINELAMEIDGKVCCVEAEKAVCKFCLEDYLWDCYFKAKREQMG